MIDGFVREIQNNFNHQKIPKDINSICFKFYYLDFSMNTIILNENEKYNFGEMLANRGFAYSNQWKLLFRGSESNFDVKLCHETCQNKSKLIWIILTKKDNVFGGYSSKKWITANHSAHKDDKYSFPNQYGPMCSPG